jgi:DNA-binding GntR family transcriptional regulator
MTDAKDQGKLADAAYRSLLAKILSHDMPGGTVIQERKLAESMNISRSPMRDALGRLEGEGLLVRLTERLLSVRVITLENYLHSLDVRAIIEPQAAALCVPSMTKDDLDSLQAELDRLADHQGPDLDDRHWQFDDRLHETIAEKSGNPFLSKLIREMRRYTKIFERQTVPARQRPGIDDHQRLLSAIATGRPEKAREVMAEHIRNVRKRALDGL